MSLVDDLRSFYEQEGATVERGGSNSYWERRYHQRRIAKIAETVSSAHSAKRRMLVDVGCGTGETLARLQPGFDAVVGVDFATSVLGRAKSRHDGVLLLAGDARCLPFRPDQFDVAVISEVLEHLEPANVDLVLGQTGLTTATIVVTTPNRAFWLRRVLARITPRAVRAGDSAVGHINVMTVSELAATLGRNGWTPRTTSVANVCPPILGERLRFPRRFERMVSGFEWLLDHLKLPGNQIVIQATRTSFK